MTEIQETMAQLEAEVRQCRQCDLCQQRQNAVPGEGNLESVIMFVGEGPGADEDEQGRPFVGRSGQLFTQILEAQGLRREDVYITNVVKCRPPGNRDPLPQEIAACRHFLDRQIAIINPRIIVTLGRISMQRWFPGDRITQIQGKVKNIGLGRCAIPLLHPAAVLRDPRRRAGFERIVARLPELVHRAHNANAEAARGTRLPAGVPHPGDEPPEPSPPAKSASDQASLFDNL